MDTSSRLRHGFLRTLLLAPVLAILLGLPAVGRAADYYWNTANGTWSTGANWSNNATSGGTTGTAPTITDTATFNQTSVNGAETISLSGDQAALGIIFANSGTTLLQSDSATTRILTIGTSGITINSGAGAVTLGNATNIMNLSLDTSATFTNNAATLFTVVNGISSATTGVQTLTIAGTGNTTLSGIIANGTATSLGLTKTGAGTLTLTNANTYTGATSINGGTIIVDANAGSGNLSSSTAITFGGTGTLNYKGAAAGSGLSVGALTFNAGEGTVQSTYGTSGNTTITFSALGGTPRAVGAVGNFSPSGGTASTLGSSGTNYFVITSPPTASQLIDKGIYFNSTAYAAYDSLGFVRGLVYTGTPDTNAVSVGAGTTIGANSGKDVRITGAISAQTTISINTLNISSNFNFALAASQTLTTGGILKTGNNAATISGGSGLIIPSGTDMTIRTGAASDSLTISNVIAGGNSSSSLTISGLGTVTLSNAANTFSGGVTLNNGTLAIGASSVVSVTITSGPVGTGTLTVSGGTTLRSSSTTAYTLHNDVNFTGNATIGDLTNTGALIFNPTTRTAPGSITITGDRTLTFMSAATFTGPVTGVSTPSLTVRGPGTLTLTNASTASTFGNVTIGDGTTFSGNGVGGNVSIGVLSPATTATQNMLGSGDYEVNYGGALSIYFHGGAFNPTNKFTVNAGGRLYAYRNGGTDPAVGTTAGKLVVNSMATLQTGQANSSFVLTGNTFPTNGVLNLATLANASTLTGNYPTLDGTMVFNLVGGSPNYTVSGSLNTGTTTGGASRTVAFNATGAVNPLTFTGGTTLNAALTIAGSGNTGLGAMVPLAGAGDLRTVTQSGGNRSITVSMAPTGAVQLAQTATGYQGGLTVNSGTVILTGMTDNAKNFGGGTVTLNGGAIRFADAAATVTDSLAVGPNGGTIESNFSGGTGNVQTFNPATAMASPAGGVVTLRAVHPLVLVGNKFDFSSHGAVVETSGSRVTASAAEASYWQATVQFNTALPTLDSQKITVRPGSTVGFDATAWGTLTDFSKFTLATDGQSVVALNNKTASGGTLIDLRSSGMNADVSLSSP